MSAPTPPAPPGARRPTGRLARWLLPLAVVTLVALTYGAVVVQHTAGSYLRGESLWAKGVKSSVTALTRYGDTRRPEDLAAFREALVVPRADGRARVELSGPDPDYALARRHFIEGGNDPRDAGRMARLFKQFAREPHVGRAVQAWAEADTLLDSLAQVATALERAVAAGDEAAIAAHESHVRALDARLTVRAETFSTEIAEAARIVPTAVLVLVVLTGLALIALGQLVARRLDAADAAVRATERLRLAEVKALVDDAPDIIVRFGRDLRHQAVNAALTRLTGLTPEMVIGLRYGDLVERAGFPADVAAQLEGTLARAFETGEQQSTTVAFPDAALPDRPRWVDVRFAPTRGEDGSHQWVIATARDVTALRESERALREVEARLGRAQKLEAVGQLAGGIAHEFNNLLTAVVGNLELAREDVAEGSAVRTDLDEALAVVRRATGLTRQLLTFGRQQILDTRRLDLNALVAEVGSMTRRLVGDRIHVHADLDPDPPFVVADAGQLQQVILNLVVNARDAMPEGGMLTISTGRERPPDVAEGAWVCVAVRDTGTGMDEATRARALEPFFTTKPHGQGSGLGLAVVDGIVAQARGRLRVESAPGRGTTVTMYLPESTEGEAAAAQGQPSGASRPELGGHEECILLVEDEHAVRETTRRMLERAGYAVLEAKSAEDALILWERGAAATRAHLVVTDVMLPGMDGLQLLSRLRTGRPELRALVVSGYTGHAAESLAGGDDARTATLRKPFGRDELLGRVRALLDLGE